MTSQLNSSFEELVNAKRLPGIGAIVVDKSGKQIYNQAFGTNNANDDSAPAFTNDTQMFIWSCTKLITSLCLLQLIEQGKVDSIDDPVSKYLPEEADVKVATSLDSDGKPITRAPKSEHKIIHLFTHTSGYTYDFFGNDKLMYDYRISKQQPPGAYNGLNAEWQFKDNFLAFDPGARHHYGLSIDKIGHIVDKVSGLPLEEYVAKYIVEPLGMKNTSPQWNSKEYLVCHLKDAEGKLTAADVIQPSPEPWKYGGGHFLLSTLNDYSQVLLALLNGGTHPGTGKSILKPETVKNYVFKDFIPHVGCPRDGIGKCTTTLVPGLSLEGDVGVMFPDAPRGWSCGLMINIDDVPSARKAGSGAWAGLGNLYYWIDPTAGVAGIIGTSVLPFLDQDALDLFVKVEKAAYAS